MGGKSTTSTQSTTIPKEVLDRYNAVNTRAEDVAKQPFQQYGGQFVAGLTPTQQAGIANTSAAAGMAQPYYSAATDLTLSGAQDVGPLTRNQIAYYQNPYTEAVAGTTYQALRQQQQQEMGGQTANAIRSGAFGGDRSGLVAANLARQQQLGTAQAMAPIYQQGYQQAVQTAQGQQGVVAQDLARRMQAGQQIAALGTGAQGAALQGAQAQLAAGTAEQQTQQADLTARYQQFLQERGYPFQVAQFLANIAMGTGALSGSTTTTTQPAGFFSDERLKKDAVRIGETDEGVPIYSFRYKGDHGPKQIGLMAQDVEKVHPEAVGLAAAADGRYYKTVDYEKATERPRREYGGGLDLAGADASWMGGAVGGDSGGEMYARGGYVAGGLVSPDDIRSILAAQREAFGPFSQAGLYGGQGAGAGAPGGRGIVPEAKLPVPRLATPSGAGLQAPRSGFQEAARTGREITELYKMGKTGLVGSGPTRDDPEGSAGLFGAKGKFSSEDNAAKRLMDLVSGRASGGAVEDNEIDPYEISKDPLGDVVKSGRQQIRELPKPGQPPGAPKSGLGEVADLAKAGSALYSFGSTVVPAAAEGLTALAALLPFSDERMKKNVAPVGETYDGQTIYKYNLGDGPAQLGLMAQESRKDAVHEDGLGLLHLDYDKATEGSKPFAYGGLVPRPAYREGGDIESYSPEADLPAPGAMEVASEEDVDRVARALRTVESSNRYGVRGPVNPKTGDRAYGAYQIMGANLPSWSKAAVGRVVSPQEFLDTPELQEKIAKHRINQYLDRYGNPTDVASVWFSGRPASRAMNLSDYTGTSVPKYLSRFAKAYEGDLPAAGAQDVEGKASLGDAAGGKGEESKSGFGALTSEKFLVPALGFLGSMLASKSPFLGQAIGEGLVGGVGAYQGLAGLEKTRAEAAREQASAEKLKIDAQQVEFNQLYERRWVQGRGWEVIDKRKPFAQPVQITDAKLNPIPGIDPKLGAVPVAKGSESAPGAGANVLSPKQETRPPTAGDADRPDKSPLTDKDITQWQPTVRAPQDFTPQGQYDYAYGTPEYRQVISARDKGILEEQSRKGGAAIAQLTSLERMRRNIDALPDQGFTRLGAFAEQRKAFAEKANDLVGVIGGKPAFSPDEVARLEELSKDAFRLGSQFANSIGSREPGFIVQQAVVATPNISMTKQGYRLVASGLTEAARYEKDKANFMDDYFSRFGNLNGAEELFSRLNPYQKYAQRALANVADPTHANALKEYVAKEGVTEAQKRSAIQKFDAVNGRGVGAAILGLQ